jgi:protein phosphatase
MQTGSQAAKAVLFAYRPLLDLDASQCGEIGNSVPIPTFEEETIIAISDAAQKHFERGDILINVKAPVYVVGDIHGNIFDLLRILILAKPPPSSRLLFLGDYVDRGEYSVEVVTLLFSFLVVYPDHIILLRGNHEFEATNSVYGFSTEVDSQYGSKSLYEQINNAFLYMPLVAIIDNEIFCVHGGIAPQVKNLSQIRKIRRPLPSYEVEVVSDLVWSDPCCECSTFDESARGLGVQFGPKALQEFLVGLKMRQLLRAHQCIQSGISRFPGDLLYTVFSCSRYEGQSNRCGLLFVSHQLHIEFFSLPPIDQIPRLAASLRKFTLEQLTQELQAGDCISLNVKILDAQHTPTRTFGTPKLSNYASCRNSLLLHSPVRPISSVLRQVGPYRPLARPRSLSSEPPALGPLIP